MPYLVLVFLLFSCVTREVEKPIIVDEIYRSHISVKIDEIVYNGGVYVVDHQLHHMITAYLDNSADKFVVSSCDRHLVWDDPESFVEFDYTQDYRTDADICPIEIAAFSRSGKHSWAYIDFRSTENLNAKLTCNGEKKDWMGVSVCQSKEFIAHTITFDEPVMWVHSDECPEPQTLDLMKFELTSVEGKCFYLFENEKGFHRTTVIGYENMIEGDVN